MYKTPPGGGGEGGLLPAQGLFYIISEIHQLVQIKSNYWIHMVWLLILDRVTPFLEKCYSCRKEKAPFAASSFM